MALKWNEIGGLLAIIFLGLLLFGVIYNLVVQYFQKKTHHYTAEFVAGGCLVTVIGSGFIIGWENVIVVLICFAGSGIPMWAGSALAHARDEEDAKKVMQNDLHDLQELTK